MHNANPFTPSQSNPNVPPPVHHGQPENPVLFLLVLIKSTVRTQVEHSFDRRPRRAPGTSP
jgi:hypothetical protein